jgi:hypothetical protein
MTFLLDSVPLPTSIHAHDRMRSCSPGVRARRGAAWLLMVAVLVTLLLIDDVSAARNYYKVMGVDKEADERTIKRAYRVSQLL